MINRRALLAGPACAAIARLGAPAEAATPPAVKQTPGVYRYRIGSLELTALYDGIWYRPITDTFIRNAPFAEVESALADAFMPNDKLATPFTTLIVNTGKKAHSRSIPEPAARSRPPPERCATIWPPRVSIRKPSTRS